MAAVRSVKLKVGLEVHVELSTRSKVFSRAPNPAHPEFDGAEPNTLIDPLVLGLPGSLPVMNRAAVEMAMMVGLALSCSIAPRTKWDRKSYFYPDLPKGYQISQYDLPLCFDGAVDVPAVDERGSVVADGPTMRIGIIRAHLEEDAGKLLHEAPGGTPIDFSIVDLNRAGTPLLEIVTQPDFDSADGVVAFARILRNICRFLGVTEGIMQRGHMRFEPNINTMLTLDDGRTATTPIVEIKNLNSFRSLKAAVEYEAAEQPRRWERDGREMGRGQKRTMGWDDARGVTVLQREKEDAHDYRYFPDPDLPPVVVSDAWREEVRARIPELPLARQKRYVDAYGLSVKEAAAIVDERDVCLLYEAAIREMMSLRPLIAKRSADPAVKTSGKSGLHVTVPWTGGGGFDEARSWASEIAEELVDQVPDLATLERSKSGRHGKVYIDIEQNALGKHAAPPYVVRGVPEATVSTPLEWDEVTPHLDPKQFTMETILGKSSARKSGGKAPGRGAAARSGRARGAGEGTKRALSRR